MKQTRHILKINSLQKIELQVDPYDHIIIIDSRIVNDKDWHLLNKFLRSKMYLPVYNLCSNEIRIHLCLFADFLNEHADIISWDWPEIYLKMHHSIA